MQCFLNVGGDDIEDGVTDREQVDCEREKEEVGERQTRRDNKRTLKHVTSWMTCGWNETRTTDTWSHDARVITCARCMRKLSCEVYLSTPPVDYSGSLSTVNGTNCNRINFKKILSSHPIPSRLVPPRCA